MERERRMRRIPILAMTANGTSKDVESSLNAGCDAHLSEPMSKLELFHATTSVQVRAPLPPDNSYYRNIVHRSDRCGFYDPLRRFDDFNGQVPGSPRRPLAAFGRGVVIRLRGSI